MIRKIHDFVDHIEGVLAVCLISMITGFVFFSAVGRAIGFPLPWGVEFSMAVYAWVAFFAISQALKRDAHMGVDLFTRNLPKNIRISIAVFNELVITAFILFIIVFSYILAVENATRLLSVLQISYIWINISLFIAGLSMLLTMLIRIYDTFKLFSAEEAENKEKLGD